MKIVSSILMAGALLLAASTAQASAVTSQIRGLYFSQMGNFPFRVAIDISTTECLGAFLYVDNEYGNYDAYVAGLLLAYTQKQQISAVYTRLPSGYCKLVEFGVT